MFASRMRIETVIRVLLIAVISVNAAVPTKALDNSGSITSPSNNENNSVADSENPQADLMSSFDQLPIAFVPNVGQQEDEAVRFQAQGLGGQLFFSQEEVVFSLFNPVDVSVQKPEEHKKLRYDRRQASVLRIQFQDAKSHPEITSMDPLPGVVNYLRGTDPDGWLTNVPTYSGVAYQDLYPGIELRYEGTDGILKSSFYVTPGANPSAIVWKYKGADSVELDASGNLVITLPPAQKGESGVVLTESAPVAWQEVNGTQVPVTVQYKVEKNDKTGFLLPNGYDPTLPLVIDPELTASTYLGGSRTDEGNAITVDADGNFYVTGSTASTNFPTVNPIQTNRPSTDVFITKLDPVARTILYSTYLGGNEPDRGRGIRLDSQGRITLVGETESSDFPTVNAYDATHGGGICGTDPCDDVFVAQLAPNGSSLRYSTYLGTSGQDEGAAITLDSSDRIYITGNTGASGFPVVNGYDTSFGGGTCSGEPCPDGFVAKLDPAATGAASLLSSTYLGGNSHDRGRAIALDANGSVYVAGYTNSDNFPVRSAYQATRVSFSDVFVSKFNLAASGDASLLYSTYFGGNESDHAYGIAVAGENQVYFTGYTQSSNFPGASNTFGGGTCGTVPCFDAYAVHLDIGSNSVIYSTYLGGSHEDRGSGIALDPDGSAYITGSTKSINFPLANEIQPLKGGDLCGAPPCADAFVVKLNATGNAMIYSTYLGGDAEDLSSAIAVDTLGGAYITGYTFSSNFPVTNGSGISSSTYSDVFVAKIFDTPPPTPTPTGTSTSTPAPTDTPTLTPTKVPPAGVSCFDWREGNPHGWIQSPWVNAAAQVMWDSNGMYGSATTSGSHEVGAYLQMPPGGVHKVLFYGQNLIGITVAQGASAPGTSGSLTDVLDANPDGSYLVTDAYLEVKWSITAPIDLETTPVLQSFCYSLFNPTATPRPISSRIYTLSADFDEGTSINVTHSIPDQLRLDNTTQPFNFIWVAVSSKGTVVKINTETGAVLGEYKTAPDGHNKNPSRTTVDHNGNVWVANRNENSVAHIGLVENGQCVDRNNNGSIETSTGLNNILSWLNTGGVDDNGGVSTAADECILHYVRVSSYGTRHVSVDANNDVWVSGTEGSFARRFNLIDGETGAILRTEGGVGYGGYGGLIDDNNVIWSTAPLLRWDTSLPLTGPNGSNWTGYGHANSYGICIDSQGNVWETLLYGNAIHKFAPNGALLGTYGHGYNSAQGCVVDQNDHVWVAHVLWGHPSVGHLKNDGTFVGNVIVPSGPTGVAVDGAGKIWSTNHNTGNVSRIDPNAGPLGPDGVTHIGAVDFTSVNLGGTLYNYSDMTGSTLTGAPDDGTWSVIFDSAIPGAEWGNASWFSSVPGDGSLTVTAASSEDGTNFVQAVTAVNGEDLDLANGRYLKVVVSFQRASTGESPVLYDLRVGTVGYLPPPTPIHTPTFIPTDTPTPSNTPTITPTGATSTPTYTSTPSNTPTSTATPPPTAPPLSEMVIPGWIGSPAQQATVTGVVPITLAAGITLQSGIVDFWPVNDLTQIRVLATNVSGNPGDTLATLDTTTLANGSYVIRLQGTDSNGAQQDSGILITVAGDYKPGRVRFTITDLTIPVVGLPITIARTYDSLERSQVGDFGYGWSLDIGNPKLETNPAHDVTVTMPDGRRSTFRFTPRSYGGVFSFFLYPAYTPEAGVYGSLTSNGCDLLVLSGGQYYCFLEGDYQPTEYTYTDPFGRKFVMKADGTLKTITDLNNNVLTFSPSGITSSAGNVNVPFQRDAQGRITKITYPAGEEYVYEYKNDTGTDTGELRKVTFPSVTLPDNSQQAIILRYDYFADHFFKEATDPRGYKPVITTYDASGRVETVTDVVGNLTTYSYDLGTRTTTIHYLGNPADPNDDLGDATLIYNAKGDLESYANPSGETTLYEYDPNTRKLVKITDPLTHATRYTYDANGHPTSIIDPLNHTLGTIAYNKYGGPTTLTTAQGSNATVAYNADFMPTSATDSLGSLGGYSWTPQGNPDTYTDQNGETTDYGYTPQGYVETKADPLGHTTHFIYDLFGRVTDMTVAHNTVDAMTTHYVYDELGRLTEVTAAFATSRAATTRYEYDANGNRTAVVDPLGRRTEYEYDTANRLTLVTFAAHAPSESTQTKYVYNFYGRLTDMTVAWGTPEASTTHYIYDDAGRQTNVITAFGTTSASTTHYVYYADGRVKDVTVAYGTVDVATTHYAYDAAGRTTNVTIAAGTPDASTTHYEYYDSGLLRSMTTAYGTNVAATTTYFYDSRGRLTTTQYPDGTTTNQFYDPLSGTPGSKNSTVDQAGVLTTYLYDAAGRLDQLITSAVDPVTSQTYQHISNYEYDAADRLTDSFDPLNHHTSFTYYPTGQMATRTFWLNATTGHTTNYDYNLAGEQISVTDANGHVTQYQYNELGLPKKTIYQPTTDDIGPVSTSQTYDAVGRLLTSTDENGIVTRSAYDAADQLISVTLADGTVDATTIQYGYNFAGQLTSIRDAKDHVTSFQYNKAGQQIRKTLPDNTTYEQFGYNAAGNMISHRLEDGNTNTFRYDRMNRLTDIVYFDGRSITFEYTNGGQRRKASVYPQPLSVPQVYSYSYDPFQRLKQVAYPDGRAVAYTYYDNDLRQTMTTPAGTITYGYDALDRLTSVLAGSAQTTYEYDPVGFMTDANLPNGVHTEYTPNERDQLKSVVSTNSTGATLLSFAYELDKAGNRKKVNELGGNSIAWDYDNLYRLTSETRRNSSNTITSQAGFTYDDAGNRDSMTVNGATTTYQYNVLDQLTTAGTVTYQYDGRGNMNRVTNGSQITNYTYNAADELASVSLPGGTSISYLYDGDGRRVKQTAGSQVTNYLWDEASAYGDVVLETNNSGATVASYVLGGTGLISQTRSGATSYFLQDGQGSTRSLTNAAGAVTDTYAYTAFGDLFSSTGATVNSYRYTGQQFDSLTGLYSLRARYYAPGLGRFLSQDIYPFNFGNPVELNRYVYTANDPINRMDPTGYNSASEETLILWALPTIGRPALVKLAYVSAAVMVGWVIGLLLAQDNVSAPEATEDPLTKLNEWIRRMSQGWPEPPGEGRPLWEIVLRIVAAGFLLASNIPVAAPDTEKQESDVRVLIVGEDPNDYSYSKGLILTQPNWYITASDYGNGSNDQTVANVYGRAIKVRNVDATRLESGVITGLNHYDTIIFNAPSSIGEDRFKGGTDKLIDDVLRSALFVLKPGGQMRFSSTGFMPGHEHLKALMTQRPVGYSSAYSKPFLSDQFGIPYTVRDINGNPFTNLNFNNMKWYIFVK